DGVTTEVVSAQAELRQVLFYPQDDIRGSDFVSRPHYPTRGHTGQVIEADQFAVQTLCTARFTAAHRPHTIGEYIVERVIATLHAHGAHAPLDHLQGHTALVDSLRWYHDVRQRVAVEAIQLGQVVRDDIDFLERVRTTLVTGKNAAQFTRG